MPPAGPSRTQPRPEELPVAEIAVAEIVGFEHPVRGVGGEGVD
jgi:hypothetical protein